jgi:hypothetical protein
MKGKNRFTSDELNLLRQLIRMRNKASERGDKSAQKRIRQQMRDIDFYGGDDFGINDLQLEDLDRLISSGQITIIGLSHHTSEIIPLKATSNVLVTNKTVIRSEGYRRNSDESYIIDLCDSFLGQKASRQHTFDFLRGDPGEKSLGKKLPVDAYYDSLKLVVEFAERQHTEEVKFFDKPDRMTVSGVNRGEQRKLYDQRRHQELPSHGIRIVTFGYDEFQHDWKKKLLRIQEQDVQVISSKLKDVKLFYG